MEGGSVKTGQEQKTHFVLQIRVWWLSRTKTRIPRALGALCKVIWRISGGPWGTQGSLAKSSRAFRGSLVGPLGDPKTPEIHPKNHCRYPREDL